MLPYFNAERAAQERGLEILDEVEDEEEVSKNSDDHEIDNAVENENDGTLNIVQICFVMKQFTYSNVHNMQFLIVYVLNLELK